MHSQPLVPHTLLQKQTGAKDIARETRPSKLSPVSVPEQKRKQPKEAFLALCERAARDSHSRAIER